MRARIAASVVLAVGILLGTSGCNLFDAQATLQQYDPSDGVSATVGGIDVRNALLISEDGETANLVATLVNSDEQAHRLGIQYESSTGTITDFLTVDGNSTQIVGVDTVFTLSGLDSTVGSLFPVFFQYGQETGVDVLLPVLNGDLAEYSQFVPTPAEDTVK